jgi:hypothetical protein
MKPIGLTTKSKGELAIVHECLKCGRLSSNRIAGDDNPHSILSLLDQPVKNRRISMLAIEDREQVLTALFGYNHPDM